MRKVFLSFADSRMHRALRRINLQAHQLNCYDHVITTDESGLDIRFREDFRDKLSPSLRGYGYWCWKPQIIIQILNQLDDGDILQYTDAGCHLNPNGLERLKEYFQLTSQSETGILAFQAIPPIFHDAAVKLPNQTEMLWCKGDLCDYFNARDKATIMDSPTIGAGIIFIKKCDASLSIIKKWLSIYRENFSLLDDTPSESANFPGFIAHRHDQSIFSILCKLNKVETISAYEYWYPSSLISMLPDWEKLKFYPIHVKRDKGIPPLLWPYYLIIRVLKRIKLEAIKRSKYVN
jgi:hypothetical protein